MTLSPFLALILCLSLQLTYCFIVKGIASSRINPQHYNNGRKTSIRPAISFLPTKFFIAHPYRNWKLEKIFADMVTVAILSAMSDCLAQWASLKATHNNLNTSDLTFSDIKDQKNNAALKFDVNRTIKFFLFGFFDGFVGHTWFLNLEKHIQGTSIIETFARIAADALMYTPLWCVWFLFAMTILDREPLKDFGKTLSLQWLTLVKLTTRICLPLACFLYSIVPVRRRVFTSAVGTMITTTALSLWNARRRAHLNLQQVSAS